MSVVCVSKPTPLFSTGFFLHDFSSVRVIGRIQPRSLRVFSDGAGRTIVNGGLDVPFGSTLVDGFAAFLVPRMLSRLDIPQRLIILMLLRSDFKFEALRILPQGQ
jgi:hypothetical protein